MFGELAVAYLFLGGAGAGALVVSGAVDLLWVRTPFGEASRVGVFEAPPAERAVSLSQLAGLGMLAIGALCLALDLGRLDRVLDLVLRPSPTLMTLGAYAIGILLVLAAVAVAPRFAYLPALPARLVRAAEACTIAVGAVVAVYTGLLLRDLGSVALWDSPLVPVLFALSSLSCGIACVLGALALGALGSPDASSAAGAAARAARMRDALVRRLAKVDLACVALEAVAVGAFCAWAELSGRPGADDALRSLMLGEAAGVWWVGFGVCGLAVPFAVEALAVRRGVEVGFALAVAAACVLVGGCCMRAAVVGAGSLRPLALERPLAQEQAADEGETDGRDASLGGLVGAGIVAEARLGAPASVPAWGGIGWIQEEGQAACPFSR